MHGSKICLSDFYIGDFWQEQLRYDNFVVFTSQIFRSAYSVYRCDDLVLNNRTNTGYYLTYNLPSDILSDQSYYWLENILLDFIKRHRQDTSSSITDIVYHLFPEHKTLLEKHILNYSKHKLTTI